MLSMPLGHSFLRQSRCSEDLPSVPAQVSAVRLEVRARWDDLQGLAIEARQRVAGPNAIDSRCHNNTIVAHHRERAPIEQPMMQDAECEAIADIPRARVLQPMDMSGFNRNRLTGQADVQPAHRALFAVGAQHGPPEVRMPLPASRNLVFGGIIPYFPRRWTDARRVSTAPRDSRRMQDVLAIAAGKVGSKGGVVVLKQATMDVAVQQT